MADDFSEETKVANVLGLSTLVPEVYRDLLKPATRELGKGLEMTAKAVNLALSPIQGLVWGGEQIRDYITAAITTRLRNIPPEQIVRPKPSVAGPTVEALKFFGSESELRNLFANLLAASMNERTASEVHPAFVDIIKQLSADEAKILSKLAGIPTYPHIISETVNLSYGHRATNELLKEKFALFCTSVEAGNPEMGASYLDNLRRLQLLEIKYEYEEDLESLVGTNSLYADDLMNILEARRERFEELVVTALGQRFIQLCIGNP